jgi:aromatic-L-amino-acid/L-tryptophan decarboxylase
MNNQTLDPDDWESVRKTAHQMMDDVIDYLKDIREQPVWKHFPDESKAALKASLPKEEKPLQEVYKIFEQHIFPYTKGNIHPRFWAWVQGTGTITGVLADMLASTMNPNVTIGEQSAVYVDAQVINWCKEMMGFPENASGMLVSGASLANTTALTVARNAKLENVPYLPYMPVKRHTVVWSKR